MFRQGRRVVSQLPVEDGFGGLIRFLGKNVVYPNRNDISNSWRRFDYSWEEFRKQTPRTKHGTSHRYYNWTYLLDDLRRLFDEVMVWKWPLSHGVPLALFVRATEPKKELLSEH